MSDTPQNPYVQPPPEVLFSAEEPPKTRGCFFYGCLIAGILAVLGVVIALITAYVAYSWLDKMSKEYTGTAPINLPQVSLPEEDRKALDERWTAFTSAVDKGEAAELTLTADEVNALINEQPELKGKFYITIKGDKVGGKMSIPLDSVPIFGKGRFLNGSATFTVSLHDGDLVVRAKEVEVNGKSPPPEIMGQLGNENLAKNVANDPKIREKLSRFDAIEVKDDKIHLKAHAKSAPGDVPKEGDDADGTKAKEKDKDKEESHKDAQEKEEQKKEEIEKPKPDDAPGDDMPAEKKQAA